MNTFFKPFALVWMLASATAFAQLPPLDSFPQGPNTSSPCYKKRCTPEERRADLLYERQRRSAQYAARFTDTWATEYVKEQADLWTRFAAESGTPAYWKERVQSCAKLPVLLMAQDANGQRAFRAGTNGTGPYTTLTVQSPELVNAYVTANNALQLFDECVNAIANQEHSPSTGALLVRGASRFASGPSAVDLLRPRWEGLGTAAPIVKDAQIKAWKEPQNAQLEAWLTQWRATIRVGTETLENGPVLAVKGNQVKITQDVCLTKGVMISHERCRSRFNCQSEHEEEVCTQWGTRQAWVDKRSVDPAERGMPRELAWAVHNRWGIGTGWRPQPISDIDWVSEAVNQCTAALQPSVPGFNTNDCQDFRTGMKAQR